MLKPPLQVTNPRPPAESHGLGPAGTDPNPDHITPSWDPLSTQITVQWSRRDAASIHKQQRRRPRLLFDFLSPTLWFHTLNAACCLLCRFTGAVWVIVTAREVFICLSQLSPCLRGSIGIWALLLERTEVKPGDKHLIISAWERNPVTQQHSLICQRWDEGQR